MLFEESKVVRGVKLITGVYNIASKLGMRGFVRHFVTGLPGVLLDYHRDNITSTSADTQAIT
jgi:hypothetical protein